MVVSQGSQRCYALRPSSSASGRSGRSPGNAILETLETKDVVTPSLHPNFSKKSSCYKPSAHTMGIYGVLGTLFWNDGKHHGTPACARWQWRSCRMGPGLVFFPDFCSRGHHVEWPFNMISEHGWTCWISGFRQQPSADSTIAIELIWSLPLGNKTRQYTFFIAHAYEICLSMHFWISWNDPGIVLLTMGFHSNFPVSRIGPSSP